MDSGTCTVYLDEPLYNPAEESWDEAWWEIMTADGRKGKGKKGKGDAEEHGKA